MNLFASLSRFFSGLRALTAPPRPTAIPARQVVATTPIPFPAAPVTPGALGRDELCLLRDARHVRGPLVGNNSAG